jgi:hypothetical protein
MHISRRRLTHILILVVLIPASCGTASHVRGESTADTYVATVRYLGKQFQGNSLNLTGQDCASSIVLPSGEALWVFGDTIEGPFESIRGLPLDDKLSNTAAIVPRQNVAEGIKQYQFVTEPGGKRARQIVPFVGDEKPASQRIWPIHGLCRDGHIYVFYHRISLIPGVDVFDNFNLDGMGIARAKTGDWKFERLKAPDGTYEFWKGDKPTFGVFVQQEDGVAYVWGSLMTGMFLARTSPDKIADLASYEYLIAAPTPADPTVKPVWSKTFEPTAVLFDSVPNEMSVSYNAYLKRYIAIHCRLRENEIVMRTAPEIAGPWSEGEVIYRPEKKNASDLFYAAKEHPELAQEEGKVLYVTYIDSRTYAPQLIEVTLK